MREAAANASFPERGGNIQIPAIWVVCERGLRSFKCMPVPLLTEFARAPEIRHGSRLHDEWT